MREVDMAVFTSNTTAVNFYSISFLTDLEQYSDPSSPGPKQTDNLSFVRDIVVPWETNRHQEASYTGDFDYTNDASTGEVENLTGDVTSYSYNEIVEWSDEFGNWETYTISFDISDFSMDINAFVNAGDPLELLETILSGDDEISGVGLLAGFGGNDVITGGSDGQYLNGGEGDDVMVGGTGNDTYHVDSTGDVIVENPGEGIDKVASSITHVLGSSLENLGLIGSAAITGVGNEFNNTITGNSAANLLSGRDGHDDLRGGDGDDILIGGAGIDNLTGGSGADMFLFQSPGQSDMVARDRIHDFNQAENDKINLSGIDANTAIAGNQAFTFIGTSAFSNTAGELRTTVKESDTYIHGDVDGDGSIDFSVRLYTAVNLVSADFIL
jgi:Ca2+-binding RTX toxin-like protein